MRIHVVAPPNIVTVPLLCEGFRPCAYTQKTYNFCEMMMSLGHEVFHYGAEGSIPPCSENVIITTRKEQNQLFGTYGPAGYSLEWVPSKLYWQIHCQRAGGEIKKRARRGDFVCLGAGGCQAPLAAMQDKGVSIVEYGIGYAGVFAPYKVFESHCWRAAVYGMMSKDPTISLYDTVIPNFYRVADFPLLIHKQDYLLYVGRITKRKGIQIAVDVARATGHKLLMAGPGVDRWDSSNFYSFDGTAIPRNIAQYIGVVTVKERMNLMGRAKALLAPTTYLEPFGGIVPEAHLCGTPTITTDAGGFTETVEHGIDGYRCNTLSDFCNAVYSLDNLSSPAKIRESTESRYSTDALKGSYQRYFQSILDLWGEGWYTLPGNHYTP